MEINTMAKKKCEEEYLEECDYEEEDEDEDDDDDDDY